MSAALQPRQAEALAQRIVSDLRADSAPPAGPKTKAELAREAALLMREAPPKWLQDSTSWQTQVFRYGMKRLAKAAELMLSRTDAESAIAHCRALLAEAPKGQQS